MQGMSFRRRTRFATPVILVAACSKSEPPKPKEFAGATYTVRMVDMKCLAHQRGNPPPPPRAIECPPGMASKTVFTVGELADKTCGIIPAGCVDETCVKIKTPCPLPPGKQLATALSIVWTIEKRGDACHAEEGDGHEDCPPGVDCNPPEPRIVPCPPGVTEDKPVRVAELPDATCVVVPEGCATTTCATEKTRCPTE